MIKTKITVHVNATLAFVDEHGNVLRPATLRDLKALLQRMSDTLERESSRLRALDSGSAVAAELSTCARRLDDASVVVVADWNHGWRPFDDLTKEGE